MPTIAPHNDEGGYQAARIPALPPTPEWVVAEGDIEFGEHLQDQLDDVWGEASAGVNFFVSGALRLVAASTEPPP